MVPFATVRPWFQQRAIRANIGAMVPSLPWLSDNWFQALQSLGILGGLLFAALSFRRDAQERKITNFLEITEHHREIWTEIYRRPELKRVLADEVDLLSTPITVEEEIFINQLIVHLAMAWQISKARSLLRIDSMHNDIRSFFALPIPKTVWQRSKHTRDPRFVSFVEECS